MESVEASNSTLPESSASESTAESFFDILGSALRLGGPIAAIIGGPLGAIARMGLSTLGKSISHGQESKEMEPSGNMERSLLQEAAFQAVQSMSPQKRKNLGINEQMARRTQQLNVKVQSLTTYPHKILLEPAFDIASYTILEQGMPKPESSGAFPHRKSLQESEFAKAAIKDPKTTEAFIQALMLSTLPSGGADGFFDTLGPLIQKGLQFAKPILDSAAEKALEELAYKLKDDPEDKRPKLLAFLEGATQRAVLGEAALQTVQ
ncbi:hypothetical protein MMC15_003596 [Xylographa vitiligo]|nr:hypothetical protein [Xylographa vitiligo]